MERESEQMQAPQPPTLCRSGCGFYGSPATDNLCSICYKDNLKKKQTPPNSQPYSSSGSSAQQAAVQAAQQAAVQQAVAACSGSAVGTETAQPTIVLNNCAAEQRAKENESELLLCEAAGSSSSSGDRRGGGAEEEDDDDGAKPLDDSSSSDKDPGSKKRKNRCATCRKKVGLTGFECRCGGLYCSLHRYSDMHECSFDYRELGAQEIRRNNPVVVGEKIQKI